MIKDRSPMKNPITGLLIFIVFSIIAWWGIVKIAIEIVIYLR